MMRSPPPHQLVVFNDYDVVAMRQDVREQARQIGLGLIQQAKLATASSAIARACVTLQHQATFTLHANLEAARPSFEIECMFALSEPAYSTEAVVQTLHLDDARLLVDEMNVALDHATVRVLLRLWLKP